MDEQQAPLLMTDDRDAYNAAVARGIAVTRTLRVLEMAAERGLLDLPSIMTQLRAAGFYMPEDVVDEMLTRDATRKAAAQHPPPATRET
jgi:predicted nucleic acid-binding protein